MTHVTSHRDCRCTVRGDRVPVAVARYTTCVIAVSKSHEFLLERSSTFFIFFDDEAYAFTSTRRNFGNSSDKLRHPRSAAYSVELVLLNKHQISGGGAYLN